MERPVLIAGDDGAPVRVREELAAAGVEAVSICSSDEAQAAQAANAVGARVVIGDISEAETWQQAGLQDARSVGVLGPTDLENLGAALLVADQVPDTRIVVRIFSPDLGVRQEIAGGALGAGQYHGCRIGPFLLS